MRSSGAGSCPENRDSKCWSVSAYMHDILQSRPSTCSPWASARCRRWVGENSGYGWPGKTRVWDKRLRDNDVTSSSGGDDICLRDSTKLRATQYLQDLENRRQDNEPNIRWYWPPSGLPGSSEETRAGLVESSSSG